MIQNCCEERTFQEYEYCWWSYLDYSNVYEEYIADQWNFHIVIYIAHTQELLLRVLLNQFRVYHFLKLINIFTLVRKHRLNIWMVSSHPPGLPFKSDCLITLDDVLVYILEMSCVCSVWWYVLNVGFYVMDCCCSILKGREERLYIYHLVLWCLLVFLQRMNPDVDVII